MHSLYTLQEEHLKIERERFNELIEEGKKPDSIGNAYLEIVKVLVVVNMASQKNGYMIPTGSWIN